MIQPEAAVDALMGAAHPPVDEIRALRSIHDDPDPALERIVRLASAIMDTPHAAVHIVDQDILHRVASVDGRTGPAPREDSLCKLVVDGREAIAVSDATEDSRFAYSSLVVGNSPVRFYASAPLETDKDGVIGALCVWDVQARPVDDESVARLKDLADLLVQTLEAGRIMRLLAEAAMTDPLTGLPNRRRVYETITRQLHRRERDGTAVTVAFIDLDDFKSINDRHGHEVGDLVLDEVASRLSGVARSDEMIARIGGDEFVIIGTGGMESAEAIERFAGALIQPIASPRGPLQIGASIGVAIAEDGDSADTVLTRADREMFKAKRLTSSPRVRP